MEYIDSYRPATLSFEGGERRPSTRAASLPPDLADLARDLGVDPDDAAPVKYARPGSQTDRSSTVEAIFDLIAEAGEDSSAPASAHELRRQLRASGLISGMQPMTTRTGDRQPGTRRHTRRSRTR
jgi:hypothetical protein